MQSAFYCYVALNTCLYNHNKASIRSPAVRELRYFFLLLHFRKKNKKNLMHHYAGLAGCTEPGTWSVLSQNCLLVEPIGFCKNTKRKTDRRFFSASGSGRSFPWAECSVVSEWVAVEAQCMSLLVVCHVRVFMLGTRTTRRKPRSWMQWWRRPLPPRRGSCRSTGW